MSPDKPDSHLPKNPFRQPEKTTIVFLLALSGVILALLLALAYVVPYYGLSRIHPELPWIMGIAMAGFGAFIVLALALLITVTLLGRDVPFSHKLRSIGTRFLLPVLIAVGRLVGLKKEQVQHAFVAVNNELVLAQCRNGRAPRRILLLMPHCLQDKDCTVKVTHRVQNCKRCGKCTIKDLIEVAERYEVELAVATGGTIARRIVMEKRPDLIIAVACERDLTSGIQDTTPLPVYGIFNERPFGPCLNTTLSVDHLEAVLKEMVSLRRRESS